MRCSGSGAGQADDAVAALNSSDRSHSKRFVEVPKARPEHPAEAPGPGRERGCGKQTRISAAAGRGSGCGTRREGAGLGLGSPTGLVCAHPATTGEEREEGREAARAGSLRASAAGTDRKSVV